MRTGPKTTQRRPSDGRIVAFGVLAVTIASCKRPEAGEAALPRELIGVSIPAADPGPDCADLGKKRVCFAEVCPGGVCVMERPKLAQHDEEYRCAGSGSERRCRLRSTLASPFVCTRGRCVQTRPRLPDDGDWTCKDQGGITLCRGGQQPAAVTRGRSDPGWWCGGRRAGSRDNLCLDTDPDYPDGPGLAWLCRFEASGAQPIRVCERAESPRLGDGCRGARDCPSGALCVRDTCTPRALIPNCWEDEDCESNRCRMGLCNESEG